MSIDDIINNIKAEFKVLKGDATKDKVYTSQRVYSDQKAAMAGFEKAREKLFHVNKWSDLPGVAAADFKLYTPDGKVKDNGNPEPGDFIYIDLPGPTPETWVRVTNRKESEQSAEFTVSPSPDPREKEEKIRDIEHFFADKATSTFKVELKENTLIGYEIGKNEGINNQGVKDGGREIANTLVALGGWMLFQEMQWHKLTDYLVHHIEADREADER